MDLVGAALGTGDSFRVGETRVVADVDRNGLDDGGESQANIHQALSDGSDRFPGIVNGAFRWTNWIHMEDMWAGQWARERHFGIRGQPADAVVRDAYARLEP